MLLEQTYLWVYVLKKCPLCKESKKTEDPQVKDRLRCPFKGIVLPTGMSIKRELVIFRYFVFPVTPKHLNGFEMDPSLPTDQEFFLLSIEGLSAIIKDVGGEGGFSQVQTEWNCHAQVLDYGDLTYRPLLSPFDVGLTVALYHGEVVSEKERNFEWVTLVKIN